MHISIFKISIYVYMYVYDELLRVSASHLAIFKDKKYRG
jgi:hypothetical protein